MSYGIPFDRIVAYTYDADHHCTECAKKTHGATLADLDPDQLDVDANGIPFDAEDSEGNQVHPVFPGDCDEETVTTCGDCGKTICLICGDAATTRRRGAVRLKCWNCSTSYHVGS